jgi:cobalt-zinc-cadmium efflux system membrane fusion protein
VEQCLINISHIMQKIWATMIVVMVLMSGCDSGTVSTGSAESHVGESLQATLFTEDIEFYIVFPPLEQGVNSEFLVHVTHLDDYTPCEEGKVTLQLDGSSATVAEPEEPGIFHLTLVPEGNGEFELTCTLETGDETVTVHHPVDVLGKGEVHGESHEGGEENGEGHAAEDQHAHQEGAMGEVTFTKEQAWRGDFMVREMVPEPFSSVLKTSGEMLTIPGEKKNVASPGSGMIRFPDAGLVQGSRVDKGQLLFTITAGTLEGDNFELRYQEYKNRLNSSRTEYRRHRQLYAQQVIPERQYLESRTAYIADSIRFYNLAGKADDGGLQVMAPAAGYVHHLNVSEGQYVETGQLLATISSDLQLMLRADVPQQHYQLLKEIVTARFRPAFTERVYSVGEMNGSLMARGSSVAENDHYIPLYFKVENDGTLLEGAFAECYLMTAPRRESLVVPESALIEEQGNAYVYVQVTGESYSKTAVRIGDSDGLRTEITGGLEAGQRVVTKGAMLLKSASMVLVESGHGHSH